MSVPGEKLNLLIMRDSGETKRYRVRRSWFYALFTILLCFPFICALIVWGGYTLWQENILLSKRAMLAEKLNEQYVVTVKRLTNLEALLIHDDKLGDKLAQNSKPQAKPLQLAENKVSTPESDKTKSDESASTKEAQEKPLPKDETTVEEKGVTSNGKKQNTPDGDLKKENTQSKDASKSNNDTNIQLNTVEATAKVNANTTDKTAGEDSRATLAEANKENTPQVVYAEEVPIDDVPQDQDGPGHIMVEIVDTGKVLIENVISRMVGSNRLRTSLDIRNSGDESITGDITCTLSLASGQTIPLALTPENMSRFKIARWKKTVFFANIPEGTDSFNAQMLMEIKDDKGVLMYRNVFAIEQ